ncbi:MAG TPA: TIGR01458 family HAD-type hydrolase [Longimicrobiales bacterium]
MKVSALLLDLDGTLYVGDSPLPGAVEAVRALAERGIPMLFLTNTTRRSRRSLARWLEARGFSVREEALFTVSMAAARWLERERVRRVALYVPEGAVEDFAALTRDEETPEAIVVGDLGDRWSFALLNRAFHQVMAGARLVALQKNRYWVTEHGLTLDAGPFVVALEYATGTQAAVVGKPSPAFFQMATAGLGVPAEEVAVVGDDVDADIAGARAAGHRAILVRTGKFREDRLRASASQPDVILGSIAELPDLIG